MRDTTIEKLGLTFENYHLYWRECLSNGNWFNFCVINGRNAIVIEFENEQNGFDVFASTEGNSINEARKEFDLPPLP